MVKTVGLANYSDVYYTPDDITKKIVAHFSPTGKCLEPFAGNNAFLKFLPEDSYWCDVA